MSTQVQIRKGNTAQTASFTGALAELTVDTDKKVVVVHDGSTAGGVPLARESTLSLAYNHANAAFSKANATAQQAFTTVSANGVSIAADANTDTLTITSANGVALYGDSGTDTLLINLALSGVTSGVYGGSSSGVTRIPVITVNSYGITTALSNVTINTDSVPETTTNLYFTAARVRANVSYADGPAGYNSTTGVFNIPANTTSVAEGTNLYLTAARVRANLSYSDGFAGYNSTTGVISIPANTTSLVEGNNLYFTAARARANLSYSDGFAGYNSTTGVISIPANTTSLVEGNNLYFTAARVRANVTNTAPINYDATTGTFSHATSGVTASGYGDSISIPVFVVNSTGHVTSVTNTTIRSTSTSQTGVVQLTDSISSTSTTTAATPNAVKTAYDLAATKFASAGGAISGDVSITGNLTIVGQTTYANTTTALIADNILTLNAAINQASAPVSNAGVEIDRGSSANVSLLWNESTDKWTFTNDGTTYFDMADAGRLDSVFSLANGIAGVANTDYTTISATAGVYGNASHITVTTLTANGRVSSIVNTAIAISATQVTSGTLPIARGGTNQTTYTNGIIAYDGTSLSTLANTGTAGTYGNSAFIPVVTTDAYGRVSSVTNTAIAISADAITSGTLAVARGGTGVTTSTGTGAVVLNTAPTLTSINVTNTTVSTSNTTGAITVAGGIGVKGNVYADAVYSSGSAVVTKDIYNNVIVNNIVANTTTTTSSSGTTTLTVASSYVQVLTGSLSHTFDLPNATTLPVGAQYSFNNNSTGNLLVRSAGGATLFTLAAGGRLQVTLKSAGDSNGSWDLHGLIPSNCSWGTATLSATSTNASFSGLTLNATTASTSNTTGALKVEGGIGVKGNVSANGIIFDDGTRQTTVGASIGDALALSIALG
jgi:hypothetical protein